MAFWILQVFTGYLLAGSLIGPGGLSFVSEMVQVCFIYVHLIQLTNLRIALPDPFLLLHSVFMIKLRGIFIDFWVLDKICKAIIFA